MLGSIILILLILAVLSGGLIALFAGRRFYPIWLGFATYFFVSRILDLALFRYPDEVRNWGGLIAALLVVAVVLIYRDRVVRFVPPVGGFIVSATIAERLLKYIAPEAGKYLFIFILLAGGLIGFYLFQRLLNFDTAVIVLSALWGASYVSTVVFDFVDVFLISANGLLGSVFSGFLDSTQMLQTLIWLGLAVLGVFVQRKLEYKPIPVIEGSGTPDVQSAI